MKKTKRFLWIVMTLTMLVTAFSSCGKKTPDTESDLEISFLTAGVGEEYMDSVIAGFREKHPEINVIPNPTVSFGIFGSVIKSGAAANSIDLFFMQDVGFKRILDLPDNLIEPLDGVVNDSSSGEKTIGERLNDEYKEKFTFDGSIYSLPWQSFAHGLVYNNAEFQTNGFEVPRTTDELLALCQTMTAKGKIPFIHNMYNYWSYATNGWWAQYQGADQFFDFWNATGTVAGEKVYPHLGIFAQEGRYESLSVLERILAFDSTGKFKYVVPGSNTEQHTTAQTKFINGAAMMTPNAGWLETEMKKEMKPGMDFRMMKLPVISSITDHLSSGAKSEAKLTEIIDYIDGGKSGALPSGVLESDVLRVEQARKITVGEAAFISHAVIPSYAKAKDAAKKFLLYMYSDEGLARLSTGMKSMPLVAFDDRENAPDISSWSSFSKSHSEIQQNADFVFDPRTCPVFYRNGISAYRSYPELILGATNPNDRKTAQKFFEDEYNYAASKWDDWTRGIV